MKKYLVLIFLVLVLGCGNEKRPYDLEDTENTFTVGKRQYKIITGSDGHQYYYSRFGTGGYQSE